MKKPRMYSAGVVAGVELIVADGNVYAIPVQDKKRIKKRIAQRERRRKRRAGII